MGLSLVPSASLRRLYSYLKLERSSSAGSLVALRGFLILTAPLGQLGPGQTGLDQISLGQSSTATTPPGLPATRRPQTGLKLTSRLLLLLLLLLQQPDLHLHMCPHTLTCTQQQILPVVQRRPWSWFLLLLIFVSPLSKELIYFYL